MELDGINMNSCLKLGMMPLMGSNDNKNGWNLIFENVDDKKSVTININEYKPIEEAINMYYLKSGRNDKCRFIFNHQDLFGELKICQSGLQNNSKILVVNSFNDSNKWY